MNWFLPFLSWAALAGATMAAEPDREAQPYTIPNSAVHEIDSKTLSRVYNIYVKTPPGYDKDENAQTSYPVVYLNDGPYTFQVAAGVTRLPMNAGIGEKTILVGISFAQGEKGMDSRVRDLTQTRDPDWTRYETGGGPDYLRFIEEEVIPFVETTYRADPARRTLSGQSLGGSFGAWVLLTKPELFESYILTSASLWFHDRGIFNQEEAYAAEHDDLRARVYIAVGGEEMPPRTNRSMVSDQVEFVRRLRARKYPNLIIRDDIIHGMVHETTFPIGFTRGMQWLYYAGDK